MSSLLESQRREVQQKGRFAMLSLGAGVLLWLLLPGGWLGRLLLLTGFAGAGKFGWDWWALRKKWGLRL
jgi:hypothetical protein